MLIPVLVAASAASFPVQSDNIPVKLDVTEVLVPDTVEFHSLRLHVLNQGDSAVYITRIKPSCSCILATVQSTLATRDHPAVVYIAVVTANLSALQPTVVDVFTSQDPDRPLRFSIRKQITTPEPHN